MKRAYEAACTCPREIMNSDFMGQRNASSRMWRRDTQEVVDLRTEGRSDPMVTFYSTYSG